MPKFELDGEKIEENQDGVPFLTLQWRKHRSYPRPARTDQYAAYRFHPIMGILEDEGTDQEFHRPDIYSDELPSDEEAAMLFDGMRPEKQEEEQRKQDEAIDKELEEEAVEPVEEYNFG